MPNNPTTSWPSSTMSADAVPAAARETGPTPAAWNLAKRFTFRFCLIYFLIYINPFFAFDVLLPPSVLKPIQPVLGWYQAAWTPVIHWVGDRLSLDVSVLPAGSGDTRYNYVQVLICAVVALLGALLWSVVSRKPTAHTRLQGWLRIYLRFWLGTTIIAYGVDKVIKLQFPDPSFDRLLQPAGAYTPFSLLWFFMGSSDLYTNFAGLAEVLGGALLFSRRTTTAGALVCIGVLSNVVMLNLCYDVPVKLFSMHLLTAAIFLAAPDLQRLVRVLLLNRGTTPAPQWAVFPNRWLHDAAVVVRTGFVVALVGVGLYRMHDIRQHIVDAPRSPLYGVWDVDEFQRDGKTVPPLLTDTSRWRRVVVDRAQYNRMKDSYMNLLSVHTMDDTRQMYLFQLDENKHEVTLTRFQASSWKAVFQYQQPKSDHLVLTGSIDGCPIHATFRLRDSASFPLTSRGFHWINDRPYAK